MTEPRILVVYHRASGGRLRNTIGEHLYCFRRYVEGVRFDYFNAADGFPRYLTWVRFDGVILHYTFLALRWNRDLYLKLRPVLEKRLGAIRGYKVAIPQDEYAETELLRRFYRTHGIKAIFTSLSEESAAIAYPRRETGLDHVIAVHPGYIDERAAKRIRSIAETEDRRPIDVGYRARKVPYWLGRHGQMKTEVGERFAERLAGEPGDGAPLVADISNRDEDAFMGQDWYRFLCRCRVVLGCEGGASLLDDTGDVRPRVEAYVRRHPEASFDEVEAACFPGMDYNIRHFKLTPRHFECTITRTCQALVEGDYGGVLRPGEHYLEIKRDFSNLEEVIAQIRDREACRRIADRAYRDVYESGRYTYRVFANQVVDHVLAQAGGRAGAARRQRLADRVVGAWLRVRERLDPVLCAALTAWCLTRALKLGVIPLVLGRLRAWRIRRAA